MGNVDKSINKLFCISLTLSVLFVVAIPSIIYGAIRHNTFLLVFGIVFAAGGFYVMPVMWINYASRKKCKRIVFAITVEHLLTVQKIASQLGSNLAEIDNLINTCFIKGYLIGYVRNGDVISLNQEDDPQKTLHTVKCDNCGATYTYRGSDVIPCPYCANLVNDDTQEE